MNIIAILKNMYCIHYPWFLRKIDQLSSLIVIFNELQLYQRSIRLVASLLMMWHLIIARRWLQKFSCCSTCSSVADLIRIVVFIFPKMLLWQIAFSPQTTLWFLVNYHPFLLHYIDRNIYNVFINCWYS